MTPCKLIAWPVGVWPLQVYDIYSLLRCVLGTCWTSLIVILPAMEICMGCTDVMQSIECLMTICCGSLGVLKATWFRIYANSLIMNYSSALNDYLTIDNIKERKIMRKHAFIGRILCTSLMTIAYSSNLLAGISKILAYDSNRINITNESIILDYVIPSRCALEYLNFPTSMFKIVSLVETAALMLGSTTNLVNILRLNFINFDVTSPRICDRFNALIQRHQELITLARELSDLMNFVLLIELFFISILLCIMGFQIIIMLKNNDIVMIGQSLIIISAFMIQLSLHSFIGNYLKSEMEDVGLSIYQSAWYSFPTNLQRNVNFILMQTKSPVALQAGNFIVVNLSTYVSILKTSFSYLSVLRIMLEE
ncbi:uncharacterized protein LOC109610030 isoform X2 [Camponotus floridanus]|uniref:uncharacterized protein LOC109610030 isoform X2 n=1 Tax=Camponotus floridanus TaxID=104421 RepID=UPI000DC6AD88|nr:uncharacterized protein LOC109610030 isoform X2 [Camponotus floridanus]